MSQLQCLKLRQRELAASLPGGGPGGGGRAALLREVPVARVVRVE